MQNDTLYNCIMTQVKEMIAEAGGGSSLPEVTADDNGDVLTVVSGEWAKAEPSSSIIIVHNVEGVLDKTWNEIKTAMRNGLPCFLSLINDDDSYWELSPIFYCIVDGSDYYVGTFLIDEMRSLLYVTDSADGYPAPVIE